MNTRIRLVTGAVIALLTSTALPAVAQDSAHGITRAEYDLGDTAYTDPQSDPVSEVRAVVHYPRRRTGTLPPARS